jgi:hypothetical protein
MDEYLRPNFDILLIEYRQDTRFLEGVKDKLFESE